MFTCRPTYFNCFNNLNGSGLTAVNLINIPFSIQKGRFLLLNALLNWCRWSTRILWHAESNNIELRCLEEAWNFQRFLYSQSGLHRWLTWRLVKVSCKMRIIFYHCIHTSACVILFPIALYFYFADPQQLMHWAMKKLKTWTQQTWPLKEGTSLLKTCFVNIEWYFKESCYYDGPYRKFAVVTKKLRTATMKNCFIQNHFNPNAQLIFTWKGNQFYHKHFIVV